MIDEEKLVWATVTALTPQMGVAAEFVAEDAIQVLNSDKAALQMNEETQLRIFLIALSGLIPGHLDAEGIRKSVIASYRSTKQ